MFNIKREGRLDLLLGCSVKDHSTVAKWLEYYTLRYPQFRFEIVETTYAGDMANCSVVSFKRGK